MKPPQAKKHSRKRRERDIMEMYLNGNSGLFRHEFYALLKNTQFVARVIDIQERDLARAKRCRTESDWTEPLLELYQDPKWKVLTEKHLADWLYRITDILIMQACFSSRGFPMSHAELTALVHDAFLGWKSKDLDLKDGRNEIWNAHDLKLAVNVALPEIKTIGAVTLSNLAKKINAHSRRLLFGRTKTRLSGKHLQKLFSEHDIDWNGIKKAYKQRLLEQTSHRNPAG
jgi:hypothetical protein